VEKFSLKNPGVSPRGISPLLCAPAGKSDFSPYPEILWPQNFPGNYPLSPIGGFQNLELS